VSGKAALAAAAPAAARSAASAPSPRSNARSRPAAKQSPDDAGGSGGAQRHDRVAGPRGDQPAAQLEARGGEAIRARRVRLRARGRRRADRRARLSEVHLDEVRALAQGAGELRAGRVDHDAVAGAAQGAAQRGVETVAAPGRRGAVDDRPLAGLCRPPAGRGHECMLRRMVDGRTVLEEPRRRPVLGQDDGRDAGLTLDGDELDLEPLVMGELGDQPAVVAGGEAGEEGVAAQRAQRARHVGAFAAGLFVERPAAHRVAGPERVDFEHAVHGHVGAQDERHVVKA
jgi:hypothetical protein